jgi:hypothetical protein
MSSTTLSLVVIATLLSCLAAGLSSVIDYNRYFIQPEALEQAFCDAPNHHEFTGDQAASWRSVDRQSKRELTPFPDLALYPDFSSMQLNKLLGQR